MHAYVFSFKERKEKCVFTSCNSAFSQGSGYVQPREKWTLIIHVLGGLHFSPNNWKFFKYLSYHSYCSQDVFEDVKNNSFSNIIIYLNYIFLTSSNFPFRRLLGRTWHARRSWTTTLQCASNDRLLRKNGRKWENRRHRQSAMLPRRRCIYFPRHRSGKLLFSPASAGVILSQADARDFLPLHAIVQTDSAIE